MPTILNPSITLQSPINPRLQESFDWLLSPPAGLTPVELSRQREKALVDGLNGLAGQFGKVIKGTHINARGELDFYLDNGFSGCGHKDLGYQAYGEALAGILSLVSWRTGTMATTGEVLPSNNWLSLNHFEAERLLRLLIEFNQA